MSCQYLASQLDNFSTSTTWILMCCWFSQPHCMYDWFLLVVRSGAYLLWMLFSASETGHSFFLLTFSCVVVVKTTHLISHLIFSLFLSLSSSVHSLQSPSPSQTQVKSCHPSGGYLDFMMSLCVSLIFALEAHVAHIRRHVHCCQFSLRQHMWLNPSELQCILDFGIRLICYI